MIAKAFFLNRTILAEIYVRFGQIAFPDSPCFDDSLPQAGKLFP